MPLVLAANRLLDEQLAQIDEASKRIPFFRSANMSLGINVLLELVKKPPPYWATAMTLRSSKTPQPQGGRPQRYCADDRRCCGKRTEFQAGVYLRAPQRPPEPDQERDRHQCGSAGTIVGIHEIMFAGRDDH